MSVVDLRKMQEVRCLRGLFPLILAHLINNCLVTDINAYPMQFLNPWTRPPPLPERLTHTRRTASGTPISYRLDAWSQYDNPEEGAEREGDIHETAESRKTITTKKTWLWPNGVVNYYVHSSISNEPMKLAVLEDALHTIMSKTCIKFVRIQDYEDTPAAGWVNITGHQKGCFSDLGRNRYIPNNLNLNVDVCFRTIGHAIHEMLHTLGVYHEHMRPDRDEYITIIWENIKKEDIYPNFELLNRSIVTNYGLPYDYDSIMHYPMTAFSDNKQVPTIIPTIPNVEIGQRSHMSYYDIQKLLIAYNCNAVNTVNTKDLDDNKKPNLAKHKKSSDPKLPLQNKTIGTKVKSQVPVLTVHNPISNKVEDKYANSRKSMAGFDQAVFSKPMHLARPNYYPVSLNSIYPYIHFHFYFLKK